MIDQGRELEARIGPRRLAAIDVGTNSLRLIVVEAMPDGSYRLIDDEKGITRLGRGLDETNQLHPESMELSALTIARMKGIAEGYGVEALRVVGTAACREASNTDEFVALVKARAGVDLEVISAEEEARLAYMSVDYAFDLTSIGVAVVDIGGGSTEVVLSSSGVIEQVATLKLGAVRLTERFGPGDDEAAGRDRKTTKGPRRGYDAMKRHVRDAVVEGIGKPHFTPQIMIGTGGTFTTLAGISMHRGERREPSDVLPFSVRGYEMQRSEVKHVLDWLRATPVRARARIPGLSPDRAEIIVAGLVIAERVMKQLGVNSLRIHDRGIRDGIILSMIRERQPGMQGPAGRLVPDARDRLRAARQFGVACRYEEAHSNHVARLAVQLYDQLVQQFPGKKEWATPNTRELLEAAAILHDVGYFINYSKHHKHSYHMIIHSDLPGFTHREREVVANVARYHRRSAPKSKHANFSALEPMDQDLVRKLSAILRVADGLDRRHVQCVHNVELVVAPKAAKLVINAEDDPSVDLWGAERKKELFEDVFDTTLEFVWSGATAQPSNDAPVSPSERKNTKESPTTRPTIKHRRARVKPA